MKYFFFFFSFIAILSCSIDNAHAQFTIPKSVIGSGAVASNNNNYTMVGTIGQPLIGANKNSSYSEFIGFWYNKGNIAVGVEQLSDKIPESFQLGQNYPNPFTRMTIVDVRLPNGKKESVLFNVYDIFGREVLDLSNKINDNTQITILNSQLPSPGVYYYRIVTPTFSQSKSMLFMK